MEVSEEKMQKKEPCGPAVIFVQSDLRFGIIEPDSTVRGFTVSWAFMGVWPTDWAANWREAVVSLSFCASLVGGSSDVTAAVTGATLKS